MSAVQYGSSRHMFEACLLQEPGAWAASLGNLKRAAAVRSFLFGAARSFGVACATKVQSFGAGGGGGDCTTAVTTATSTMGSSTGGRCAGFDDQASPQSVSVRILNQSPRTLFIPILCGRPLLRIESLEDGPNLTFRYDNGCLAICEDLQGANPPLCTADTCQETTWEIPPGASRSIEWDRTGLQQRLLPSACWFEPGLDEGCGQVVAAPEGSYAFSILAFSDCQGVCECDGAVCSGQVAGVVGTHPEATLQLPKQDQVDLVFDPCTFGCPEERD